MSYKIKNSERIFTHKRLNLIEDDIILPNGEESKYLKFEHTANASQVIGVNSEGKFALVKEYSHAVQRDIIGFPGGLISLDEDIVAGGKREFEEETGYEIRDLKYLGLTFPYHRRNPEKLHLFVGDTDKYIGAEREVEEIGMKVIWKSKTEIDEMIRNNLLVNSHTLAHWTQYRSFLDDTEIPEAAAIIIRNDTGKILLKKRGPKSYDSSGKWENTGGKIEKDEGIVSGLKREVKEEIDVNVKVTSHINTRVTTNPAGDTYRVYLFEGLIDSGNPKIMEPGKCTELNWVDPKNLGQYDLAEYTEEDFRFTGEL